MKRILVLTVLAEILLVPGSLVLQGVLRRPVEVRADGAVLNLLAGGETVGQLLEKAGLRASAGDEVNPRRDSLARESGSITVSRFDRRRHVSAKKIPRKVVRQTTPKLHVAEVIDLALGEDGFKASEEEVLYRDGVEAGRKSVRMRTVRKPKDAVVLAGTSTSKRPYMMARRMHAAKELDLEATAYYPGAESSAPYDDGYTALGYKAGYGVAAVDPRLVKLKSALYVEGYGYALAVDRGGDIRKKRIDLCFDTLEEAKAFGRKMVKVYVLE